MTKRNEYAAELLTSGKYYKRVVRNKKAYNRKEKHRSKSYA